MLDVGDRLVEEVGDVRVVERVHDLAAVPLADHETELAEEAELVRDRGLLHPDRGCKLTDRARRVAQSPENHHAAGRREGLHRVGNLTRRARVDIPVTSVAVNAMTHVARLA